MFDAAPKEAAVTELDPRILSYFRKAKQHRDENDLEYPIRLCKTWVKHYPHVPEFRKLLRESQIRCRYPQGDYSSAGRPSIKTPLFQLSLNPKNPMGNLQRCESVLESRPLDLRANRQLAKDSLALGWTSTSIFAWQTLLLNPRRQPHYVVVLARLLLEQNQPDAVVELCEIHLQGFPGNRDLTEMRNRASIQKSIRHV